MTSPNPRSTPPGTLSNTPASTRVFRGRGAYLTIYLNILMKKSIKIMMFRNKRHILLHMF